MNGSNAMFPQRLNGGGVRARDLANDNVLADDFAPMCIVRTAFAAPWFDYIDGLIISRVISHGQNGFDPCG